jgi:hypothetical protein
MCLEMYGHSKSISLFLSSKGRRGHYAFTDKGGARANQNYLSLETQADYTIMQCR